MDIKTVLYWCTGIRYHYSPHWQHRPSTPTWPQLAVQVTHINKAFCSRKALRFQHNFRLQFRLWISPWNLVVAQRTYINIVPCCSSTIDTDTAPGGSMNQSMTITSGGSSGHYEVKILICKHRIRSAHKPGEKVWKILVRMIILLRYK